MKLLSHLSRDDQGLPLPADSRLLGLGREAWGEVLAAAAGDPAHDAALAWSTTPAGERLLAAIFGNSPFLSGVAVREWAFLTELVHEGADPVFAALVLGVERRDDDGEDRSALMRRLRIARRRVALLAAVAEFTGCWSLEQQTAALSRFAEAAIGAAVRHLLRAASTLGTVALTDEADPERDSGLVVLGMGKLGGGELNYSSDIDLILLYDTEFYESGRSRVTTRGDIQTFFVRLARDLVRILDERTGDGYVFRTDLRLRPDPRSTPPALSMTAALTYYESVGQNWERAAMIKARPVAGDLRSGQYFLDQLHPFIWRRNLDFAAIQDIHSIKRQIYAHRGGGQIAIEGHDIKTGRGGIREIEFFAQTQQLIWGGRLREIRVAPTCEALRLLASAGRIDGTAAERLIDDYRFLRRLEHRLQMVEDAQTHKLPPDRDGVARIGQFLGYDDADRFVADLRAHLSSVESFYAELFEEAPSLSGPGNLVFTGAEDDPETLATLARLGFADPPTVAALVRGWHHGRLRATRSQRAREILTELVPELLRIFGATAQPDGALQGFDQFLSRLPAGVPLFSLFHANPGLLSMVADVMAESPRLAESLAQRPALLDAALSADLAAAIPERAFLAADLASVLGGARHFEDTLDHLRRWADERRFQVGLQLLRRGLDGLEAGAALADIAETALVALLPVVTEEFARVHGLVPGGEFAVLGMGRLGSREMTLASDIDLILIYDVPEQDAAAISDGARPLPAPLYYARLSQRLIAAITAPTAEGRLYAVDTRLRPSGAAGPIASSFAAFARYQSEAAWTWEHMALTRARPIAGDPGLCGRLAETVRQVLATPRDPAVLVADVADMRRRIAEQHPRPSPWDLRNRPGGLLDLEFLVQYLLLRDAGTVPGTIGHATMRAITLLGDSGALPPSAVAELSDASRLLAHVRAVLTVLFLELPGADGMPGPAAATLARCLGAIDFGRLDADMRETTDRVRAWYERLIAMPAALLPKALASVSDRPRNRSNEENGG